jgi:GT2 family glycosyltransferase
MNYPKVSIVILNWNGLEDSIECLESLKKITYSNYNVILIDNGSSGNDAQVLQTRFGDYIHLIKNDKTYGFAGGTNIGIKYSLEHSKPDYILSLNNDTIVDPKFLDRLVDAMESDKSIGITGPKVYYYDNKNYIQSLGAGLVMSIGMTFSIGKGKIDAGKILQQRSVDYIGFCLLISTDLIKKIGLLDETYFCYCEDADYSLRAKRAGYKVKCVPEAAIWHKKRMKKRLIDKLSEGMNVSESVEYYSTRNRFKLMRKHANKCQKLSFVIFFFGFYFWLMTVVLFLFYRDPKRLVSFYSGVKDGLTGKEGIRI